LSLSADARHLAGGAPGALGVTGGDYARVCRFGETAAAAIEGGVMPAMTMDWIESGAMNGAASGDNGGFS
jgi:hypothetical protein